MAIVHQVCDGWLSAMDHQDTESSFYKGMAHIFENIVAKGATAPSEQ